MPSKYKALNDASRLAHADLTGASPNPEHGPDDPVGSRRTFLKGAPVALAVGAVGTFGLTSGTAEASGSTERESVGGVPGFELVGESNQPGVPYTLHPIREFIVECPYPVGSKAWIAIADRDDRGGLTVMGPKSLTGTYRRMVFPRFTLREGEDLDTRAEEVYRAVCEHGFDGARGPDHSWRVVHVEYRCPDGVEHVMCGLPEDWDPRLVLGVMVKGQIG